VDSRPQSVELVDQAYRAWNADGLAAVVPFFTDEIELTDPPEMPDAGTWRGSDAVLARLDEVGSTLGREGVELVDVEEVGRDVLVTLTWNSGTGTGAGLMGCVFHRVSVDGARLSRIRVYLSEDEARASS
jgi:hypothetical protein